MQTDKRKFLRRQTRTVQKQIPYVTLYIPYPCIKEYNYTSVKKNKKKCTSIKYVVSCIIIYQQVSVASVSCTTPLRRSQKRPMYVGKQ
jgi:hypothetical protein